MLDSRNLAHIFSCIPVHALQGEQKWVLLNLNWSKKSFARTISYMHPIHPASLGLLGQAISEEIWTSQCLVYSYFNLYEVYWALNKYDKHECIPSLGLLNHFLSGCLAIKPTNKYIYVAVNNRPWCSHSFTCRLPGEICVKDRTVECRCLCFNCVKLSRQ